MALYKGSTKLAGIGIGFCPENCGTEGQVLTKTETGYAYYDAYKEKYVDILVVGGGGSGGCGYPRNSGGGGGGGAGTFIECIKYPIKLGQYWATVGAAGTSGNSGGDSCFDRLIAYGGGAGGASCEIGKSGGSSGGGGGGCWFGCCYGSALAKNGNMGGVAGTCDGGGGGGGAGGPGHSINGGDVAGGSGKYSTIMCACYAAGGGGGTTDFKGTCGGAGGGGNGNNGYTSGGATSATTCGSGGGGGSFCGCRYAPGNGAKGIIAIGYKSDGSCGITCISGPGVTLKSCGDRCVAVITTSSCVTIS